MSTTTIFSARGPAIYQVHSKVFKANNVRIDETAMTPIENFNFPPIPTESKEDPTFLLMFVNTIANIDGLRGPRSYGFLYRKMEVDDDNCWKPLVATRRFTCDYANFQDVLEEMFDRIRPNSPYASFLHGVNKSTSGFFLLTRAGLDRNGREIYTQETIHADEYRLGANESIIFDIYYGDSSGEYNSYGIYLMTDSS